MIINHANLSILNQAFNGAFRTGLQSAAPMWNQLATLVPSTTSEEKYGWLGKFTQFREWVGERQYQNLKAHDYSIKNKTFENTISVSRDEIVRYLQDRGPAAGPGRCDAPRRNGV